jgi:hypothetical protein
MPKKPCILGLGLGRKAFPVGFVGNRTAWRASKVEKRGRFVALIMPRKKKDRLRVHKEARRLARLGIGPPPSERVIPDKRKKPPKHKKRLVDPDLN